LFHFLLDGCETLTPLLNLGGHFSVPFLKLVEGFSGVSGTGVTST
jgi:hypothetical protein